MSNNLTVKVSSFSFKKGYPVSDSGNGGGFVFDCRFLNNPGRYEEYRDLTGLDEAVIEFLRKNSDIDEFLKNVWKITDAAILNYIERGFTSLEIGFGCTGGQHRSVYSAEQTTRHILETFPEIVVEKVHREQREA